MISNEETKLFHVVMEHFSFDMQDLLVKYQAKEISLEQLRDAYNEIGTEGHDVIAYGPLLDFARENADRVKLHGGFIPRTYAKKLVKEGEESVLKEVIDKDWLP